MRPSRDKFYSCLWLVEKMTRVFFPDLSQSEVNKNQFHLGLLTTLFWKLLWHQQAGFRLCRCLQHSIVRVDFGVFRNSPQRCSRRPGVDWILSVHHDLSRGSIRYKRMAWTHYIYWSSWHILYGWILVSKQILPWHLMINTKQFFGWRT